ncbi:MAG: pyridoxamine 5'-phosphate oxidase family protein [Shimia sp.]|uniref:pyridoxamine 5'-phosphate oxidase family protein n=1 Tax=Shimia sp. TaxID=1954381 RepID=UPI001B0D2ECD|nr:pyridoxamine 5'-phosphate oxidase family protein [Shimia sp.]MBO6896795.1 pyridoxamine 5'-phosphate oxidase family protein [Shimia sp.]
MVELKPEFLISDVAGLREVFKSPNPDSLSQKKCIDHLDKHARGFIARAPFLCMGTQAADGLADVTPRGDPEGFVKVLDAHTLVIPERPGNNRIDSLINIVGNPNVGLIFLVPGFDETLRVNGTAQVTTDPEILALMEVQDRLPRAAIVVSVVEVFLHCAKAFRRSKLWDPASLQDRSEMPSLSKMVLDQSTGAPEDPEEMAKLDAHLETRYRETMY